MSKRNRRKEKKAQKTAAMKYQEIEEREQKMEEERRATTNRLRQETMQRNGTNKRPRPKPITPEIQWLTTKEQILACVEKCGYYQVDGSTN